MLYDVQMLVTVTFAVSLLHQGDVLNPLQMRNAITTKQPEVGFKVFIHF